VRSLHVTRGNHDRPSLEPHCSTVTDMLFRKFRWPGLDHRVKVHMTHYPLLSWDAMHRGGIHLYGHCHGVIEDNLDKIHPGRRSMDVGIDNVHKLTGAWRPISLAEVIGRVGGHTTNDRYLDLSRRQNETLHRLRLTPVGAFLHPRPPATRRLEPS
jgi:hypothetical protein